MRGKSSIRALVNLALLTGNEYRLGISPGAVVTARTTLTGTVRYNPAQVDYYKVELGRGTQPREWITLGDVHRDPVVDGPIEILDALLMAFPTLGLAKIVWATEILLEIDIPEFRPENIGAAPRWHDLMAASDVADRETARIDCDGRGLFVYRQDGTYRVYDSRCPHQVTNIPHLALHGTELTCPKHHWKFDVTTGECTAVGDRPLKQFEHKVENGTLFAYW